MSGPGLFISGRCRVILGVSLGPGFIALGLGLGIFDTGFARTPELIRSLLCGGFPSPRRTRLGAGCAAMRTGFLRGLYSLCAAILTIPRSCHDPLPGYDSCVTGGHREL